MRTGAGDAAAGSPHRPHVRYRRFDAHTPTSPSEARAHAYHQRLRTPHRSPRRHRPTHRRRGSRGRHRWTSPTGDSCCRSAASSGPSHGTLDAESRVRRRGSVAAERSFRPPTRGSSKPRQRWWRRTSQRARPREERPLRSRKALSERFVALAGPSRASVHPLGSRTTRHRRPDVVAVDLVKAGSPPD